jgi:ABC-2 type transport system permease protein
MKALSLRRINAIMRRELIDIRRDRRSLVLTLLYPISMLIMYGYGIRYDVDNVPLTILDRDETAESRELAQELVRSGYFRLVRWARNDEDVDRDLRRDDSRAAVIIPQDFSASIRRGVPTTVQALVDGSDANSATIAQGYVLAMVNRYAATLRRGTDALMAIEVRSRVWYNPELKSVNFIVPGIIAVIMMIVGAILTALSIVKEKERGTIEQILVSPIRPTEMIVGKLVPYVLISLFDLAIIVTAGYVVFGVPIKGSLVQLTIFSLLYLISSLGVGVFVSTLADNMQTAMIAAVFLSMFPAILLSGFVFPLENMSLPLRLLSYFFPGRYFVTALRGIYLKGIGITVMWPEALLLLGFAVGIIGLSTMRFRDTLE